MKKEIIKSLVRAGAVRIRQKDIEKIKSMINSAEINAKVANSVSLNDNSATLIFREIYESIRQLGEVKWLLLGYEPASHEIALEILKEMDIKEKVKLNFLERYKKIRNDANYRGFRVLRSQAREIIEFWNVCGKEIIELLRKEL